MGAGLRVLWVALACSLIAGCGRERAAVRLALSEVESAQVASGAPLSIGGERLPSGADVQVILHGTMHAPARSARSLRLVVPGRVVSPDRLEVSADELLDVLGRGSFSGGLEVVCKDGLGERYRGALKRVRFDVQGPGLAPDDVLRESARSLLDGLGIVPSRDETLTKGLSIARLDAQGSAARAGLRSSDVIEACDGVRIHGLPDLAPAPRAQRVSLRVRSPGGLVRTLSVPLNAGPSLADPQVLRWCVLGCPVLLLLLWLAPLPAVRSLFVRGLWQLQRAYAPSALAPHKLGIVLSCAFGGWLSLYQGELGVYPLLAVYTGLLALCAARRRSVSLAQVGHVLMLWLLVSCVAAVSGTSQLLGLVNDQGALPWAFNVFARPPLGLAFALGVWHAGCLHSSSAARPSTVGLRWLDALGCSLLCALLGALFLAGAGRGTWPDRGLLALGAALGATKSLLVFGLVAQVADRPVRRQPLRVRLLAPIALCVSCAAWVGLAPSRGLELAFGAALCGLLFLGAVSVVTARRPQRAHGVALRTRSLPLR